MGLPIPTINHSEAKYLYCCDLCNYKTKSNVNFVMHKRAKHNIDVIWYSCEYCDFKTKHSRNLQAHIRTKHNTPKIRKKTRSKQFISDENDRYLSNDGIWYYSYDEDKDISNQ